MLMADDGPLQFSLFDEQDLAEITSPNFPGERLICCRNPLLAACRARKQQELLEATEKKPEKVVRATWHEKRPLRGKDKIGIRVGKVLGASKVAKPFRYQITDDAFSFERDEEFIAAKACLDRIYVIRISVPGQELGAEAVVRVYKRLSLVEQAFRISKDFALEV